MEKATAEEQTEILKDAPKEEAKKPKVKLSKGSNVLLLGGKKKNLVQINKERFVDMEIQDEANLPRHLTIYLQVTERAGTLKTVKVFYDAESTKMWDDIEQIKKALEK